MMTAMRPEHRPDARTEPTLPSTVHAQSDQRYSYYSLITVSCCHFPETPRPFLPRPCPVLPAVAPTDLTAQFRAARSVASEATLRLCFFGCKGLSASCWGEGAPPCSPSSPAHPCWASGGSYFVKGRNWPFCWVEVPKREQQGSGSLCSPNWDSCPLSGHCVQTTVFCHSPGLARCQVPHRTLPWACWSSFPSPPAPRRSSHSSLRALQQQCPLQPLPKGSASSSDL